MGILHLPIRRRIPRFVYDATQPRQVSSLLPKGIKYASLLCRTRQGTRHGSHNLRWVKHAGGIPKHMPIRNTQGVQSVSSAKHSLCCTGLHTYVVGARARRMSRGGARRAHGTNMRDTHASTTANDHKQTRPAIARTPCNGACMPSERTMTGRLAPPDAILLTRCMPAQRVPRPGGAPSASM